jgi:hypothetical protein
MPAFVPVTLRSGGDGEGGADSDRPSDTKSR